MSESDRLNRLIDKILDLEKFETGKQTIYPKQNNLALTIENAIEPLIQLIKNKNITINFENNKNIEAFYDEDRIFQVITNLISNAIKFCPEQNGLITIQTVQLDDEIKTLIIDNGKGIKKNDYETIFEKFFQSDNQNIKKPVGSGLGLAICKQIIDHHKGKIWVNQVNNGACIAFTLPTKKINAL
jgi:signal transduction histidine kinase